MLGVTEALPDAMRRNYSSRMMYVLTILTVGSYLRTQKFRMAEQRRIVSVDEPMIEHQSSEAVKVPLAIEDDKSSGAVEDVEKGRARQDERGGEAPEQEDMSS